MKKALISVATLLLLVSVTLLFLNATGSDKDRKNRKAKTEIKKESVKCEMAGDCKMSADNKKACCDSGKEMKCDKKDTKADPATCPKHDETNAAAPMKGCCAAKK